MAASSKYQLDRALQRGSAVSVVAGSSQLDMTRMNRELSMRRLMVAFAAKVSCRFRLSTGDRLYPKRRQQGPKRKSIREWTRMPAEYCGVAWVLSYALTSTVNLAQCLPGESL